MLAFPFALIIFYGQAAPSSTVKYSPTTLPEQQNWTYKANPNAQKPFVLNRLLFARKYAGQEQYWERFDVPLDFSTRRKSFTLDLTLKINQGGWLTSLSGIENWRTSFILCLTDQNGYGLYLGIAEDRIRMTDELDNLLSSRSTSFIPFDSAGNFHTYHLTIKSLICQLTIDKDPTIYSLNIVGPTSTGIQTRNRVSLSNYVLFNGDITLASLQYTQKN
jgi:hypothetical protein